MKKLLLVLVVVAMASFLLVGCLPGGTTPDPDPDPDPDPVVTASIVTTKEYTDPLTLKQYVPGSDTVTVTLPEAVEDGYAVQVAVKWWSGTAYVYLDGVWATSTDGIVWTVTGYPFNALADSISGGYLGEGYADDCEPICLVALVKHPCCPGEEVAMEIVYIDDVAPAVTPAILLKDCDPCAVVDECDPVIGGAYFEYTTVGVDETDPCAPVTTDYCVDTCSGVGAWSFIVDKADICDACPTASGTGCTVVGATDCGCLPYADTGEIVYVLSFDVEDNVGNKQATMEWGITVDTDSFVVVAL